MKQLRITLLFLAGFFVSHKSFSQLVADAGNDTALCASNWEEARIGGNPSAYGGTEPYTYAWSAAYEYAGRIYTASSMLADTTVATPWAKPQSNTRYVLEFTDSIGCQTTSSCKDIVNSAGQDFAPIGAQWYYGNRENPLGGPEAGYLLVESVRDTIINEQVARILTKTYHASDGSVNDEGIEIVFTEGKKVFYINGGQTYLLYDFTAKSGDTLEFREPFYIFGNPDTTFTMVVDSTDLITVDGMELKRIHLHDISMNWDLYSIHIERIGNIPYMFPQLGLQCDAACYDPLRCYSDPSIFYKPLTYDCDMLVTGVKDHYQTEHIKIYPNPASNVVNFIFKHPDYTNSVLQLYSADGKMVSVIVVCDQNVSVDITEFRQGVYFYNWIITEKEVKAGKFVVE